VSAEGETLAAFIPVPGEHMVRNALLAIAVGMHFGLSLKQCVSGLTNARMTKGRIEQKQIAGLCVIDDSYNASPDSMIAALNTAAKIETAGRRIAVLGKMLELGTESEHGHRLVGEAAAEAGFDAVVGVGQEAAWMTDAARSAGIADAWALASHEQAVTLLREIAKPGDLLLVKGSRGARMERVIEGLQAAVTSGTEVRP
jgi:UDP-N-acetylmuramyl pentapeptide synthase